MRYLFFMGLYVVLVAFCITDVLNHRDAEPYGMHKFLWIVLIVLVPYIGAATWIIIKLRSGGTRPKPMTPRAPDDDPEYLNWLAEQERRRKGRGAKG